ncbi:MAG: quinone oxidoreductase [Rhodobiaceae bacterium]|nr:quinone oxidoreductase [Hyphomicrobiales bacterium]MBS70581.1 quinone oxidoreductase [Rhodobiaceae bacterium]|tara:strand:+ start:567 stop:1538 length:972 start_codon:yes stop_codon:yes gene_type:complete
MKKIILNNFGDEQEMKLIDGEQQKPIDNQVLIKHMAIGVNFIDIYQRTGLYPLNLPSRLGLEASGVVEAVGDKVEEFKKGDRVCYCNGPLGAYATHNIVPENLLLHLPDEIEFETVASSLLKGVTAYFLMHDIYKVGKEDTIIFHAAAGGVGSIASGWAKSLGATVIGTVGSDEKIDYAKSNGCDHVVNISKESFKDAALKITDNEGVSVVYDSIGKDTLIDSMDSLRKRGLLVSFGNASGVPDPINILDLMKKGSLFITRPTLFDYVKTREQLINASEKYFDVLKSGHVQIDVQQKFTLEEVGKAHAAMSNRKTVGTTVLVP